MAANTLFDMSPLGFDHYGLPINRRDDPPTSKQAAEEIKPALSGLRELFYETLKQSNKPLTANEVAVKSAFANRETIRKRAKELVEQGWIEPSGATICSVTGKTASTYEVKK